MDGKHRGIVHLAFGQQQDVCCLLRIVDFRQQAGIERVVGGVTQTGDAQFMNVAANTPAQFFGCRLGEGHHQQLFDVDRPGKGGLAAEPQQKTQVECGDGEGFSGAR